MKALLIMMALLLAIQVIRPDRSNPESDDTIALKAPEKVMELLRASCYDCHSNETIWPWYSEIAPLSWSIISHVNDGRDALNFSNWENIDTKTKNKRLKRAIKTINNGMMPLSGYLKFHEEAHLDNTQKATLIKWCEQELAQ